MNQRLVTAVLGAWLVAAAAPLGAQVYKGVDENGNVVYSSSPFTGTDPDRVEAIRVDPGPTDADRAAAERRVQALNPPAGGGAGLPGGNAPPQTPPPAPPEQQQKPAIDWQPDEAVQRAGTPGREQRGAGGFAGESRSRTGASLSSERSAR
jgi:hypothetical protein